MKILNNLDATAKSVHPRLKLSANMPFINHVMLISLMIVGFITRIHAAFEYQYPADPSLWIDGLMARHIAAGQEAPLFFYGQGYMGTLHVYLGAIFYNLLGHSLLPVLLASSLISTIALYILYLWARILTGNAGALIALTLAIFGSSVMYRMIYPTMLMCGLGCCYISVLIATGRHHYGWFIALGLFAGVGWWSNALVIVFIPACAIVVLLNTPFMIVARNICSAFLAFIIGALPWILLVLDDFKAIEFVGDIESYSKNQSIATYARLVLSAFDLSSDVLPWPWVIRILIAVIFFYYCRSIWRCDSLRTCSYKLMPLAIVLSSLLVCINSGRFNHVPAVRYIVPIVPVVMVIMAIASIEIYRLHGARFASLVPGALLIYQLALFPWSLPSSNDPGIRRQTMRVNELIEFCSKQNIDAIRAHHSYHWLTFASKENIVVSTYPRFDRYRPSRGKAAVADNLAVIDDYRGFNKFIARAGGSASRTNISSFKISYDLKAPANVQSYVPQSDYINIVDNKGNNISTLLDNNLSTPPVGYYDAGLSPESRTFTVTFSKPVSVCGLDAYGPTGEGGSIAALSVLIPDGSAIDVYQNGPSDSWFWSGPSAYIEGMQHYASYRFGEQTAIGLKLEVPLTERGQPACTEIQVVQSVEQSVPDVQSIDALISAMDEYAIISMIYAPRWMTERLHAQSNKYQTSIPEDAYLQYDGFDKINEPLSIITINEHTVFIVHNVNLARTKSLLSQFDFKVSDQEIGSWHILTVSAGTYVGNQLQNKYPLAWTENGLFLTDPTPLYMQYGIALPVDAKDPAIPLYVRFENGITLKGISLNKVHSVTGNVFKVDYYWSCPADVDPTDWVVFVHCESDEAGRRFQDDHLCLYSTPLSHIRAQINDETFMVSRTISVSEDVSPGSYSMYIGLYTPSGWKRLACKTKLPHKDRKVKLPVMLDVH